MGLARDYDGKVQVVDNQRISVTQKQSVMDALTLVQLVKALRRSVRSLRQKAGIQHLYYIGNFEISQKRRTYHTGSRSDRYSSESETGTADPGRQVGRYSKVRGKKQAKRVMLKAMKEDFDSRFAEYAKRGEMCLEMAYTGNQEEAEEFKKEVQEMFPDYEIQMDPLSLSVACHIGYGALAVACSKKVTV